MTTKKTTEKQAGALSTAERTALKERTKELKAQARKEDSTRAVLAKIAEMPEADRTIAERVHEIVTERAPELVPRTYYGMPAYALDDKIVCFVKPASKFGVRYATFEFEQAAALDDGDMWPIGYAVARLTTEVEERIGALVDRAVGR